MIINSKIKNTSDAIDYLNRAVFGDDPETSVLTRVYEGVAPIQDRVTAVENSAALVDVQALKDKVDELSNLTEIFANLAYPMPNLVNNSDLLTPKASPNQNQPLDFTYFNATNISLSGGIATFTANAQFGLIESSILLSTNYIGDKIYIFSRFKSDSNNVRLNFGQNINAPHSGDNNYNFISMINDITVTARRLQISDYRGSAWTPIEVDYIGAFNVSQMMLNGIKDDNGTPFTLLTNAQIKTQLDLWVQTRFPLDVLLMMRS